MYYRPIVAIFFFKEKKDLKYYFLKNRNIISVTKYTKL